ncbi:MAG TPA: preprotein translocase subunit YajC [Elusimicrobiales bacterium]|nr:preprotein translocase subunit YajC [Elusimicrobiales bacterium]
MEQHAQGSIFDMLPLLLVFFGIFYFLIIRPQKKQEKEHQDMLSKLDKGDQVVTTGGIIGTVAGFKDNNLELKVAENVKITVLRSAVMNKISAVSQPAKEPVNAK